MFRVLERHRCENQDTEKLHGYSGTDHVTFHLDGTGATSCGAGCDLQSFTGGRPRPSLWHFLRTRSARLRVVGSVATGSEHWHDAELRFARLVLRWDMVPAGFLPHQTYSAKDSGFSGAECSEPYSHNTLVLTLDPSIGGGISAGWFPEAPSFDAPTMHGSHGMS